MFYALLLGIAVIGFGIYISIMFSAIPGALDERLGVFEQLPESLGNWFEDAKSSEALADQQQGRIREVRYLLQPGTLFSRESLVRQVRLRDATSKEIVQVLPEQRVPRRRKQA